VREVLKHSTVEKLYFVEIDEEVIRVSKEFFPSVSIGIEDPRVEMRVMDGADFVRKAPSSSLDILIVDSTDIIGFARSLFKKEFFNQVKGVLTEEGMFVTHCESLHFHRDIVVEIQNLLKGVFPRVDLYTAPIATYPGNWWAFSVGSKGLDPRVVRREPPEVRTRYYDAEIHGQAFVTPNLYRKIFSKEVVW
jgi:spermidine synthase